jgi:hypothetical protein
VFLNTIPPYYWSYYSVPIKPSYSGWSWSILSADRFPWTHLCTLWLIYYVQLVLSSLMFLNWGLPANSFNVDNKSSRSFGSSASCPEYFVQKTNLYVIKCCYRRIVSKILIVVWDGGKPSEFYPGLRMYLSLKLC